MTKTNVIYAIDSALKGLAVARLSSDEDYAFSWLAPAKKAGAAWPRMMDLRRQLRTLVQEEIQAGRKPRACFVEAPISVINRKTGIDLAQVVAVVKVVLEDLAIPVFEVQVGVWKLWVTGKGNSSKEEVKDFLCAANPDLPTDEREDFYDAMAIGLYGRAQLLKRLAV